MSGRKEKFTAEEVSQAIIKAKGILSVAADLLGCSRRTIYNYIQKYKTVKDVAEDQKEKTTDWVFNKLLMAIKKDNLTAIMFYLKTVGKDRGFTERFEHTGADEKPIPISIIEVEKTNVKPEL